MLLWSIGLDYMFKINKVNVELKQQIEEENLKLQEEKNALKMGLKRTQKQLIALGDKSVCATDSDDKEKFTAAIVEEVHRLEGQSTKISVVQMDKSTTNANNEGWVYLGKYADGAWKTRYFDFLSSAKPDELVDRKIAVKVHSINIRSEKYSGEVVQILSKGQVVLIKSIENYFLTDYVWAKVQY